MLQCALPVSMATEPVTRDATSERTVERSTIQFFLLWGITVAVVETVAFRLVGQFLLNPANGLVLAGLFIATIPAMALLTYPVYRWRDVSGAERQAASVLYLLPQIVVAVVALVDFAVIYPNMVPGAARYYGAIILLGSVVVLITGFVPRSKGPTHA